MSIKEEYIELGRKVKKFTAECEKRNAEIEEMKSVLAKQESTLESEGREIFRQMAAEMGIKPGTFLRVSGNRHAYITDVSGQFYLWNDSSDSNKKSYDRPRVWVTYQVVNKDGSDKHTTGNKWSRPAKMTSGFELTLKDEAIQKVLLSDDIADNYREQIADRKRKELLSQIETMDIGKMEVLLEKAREVDEVSSQLREGLEENE